MFIFLPATLDNICGGDIIGEGLSVSQIKISRICKSLVLFIIVFAPVHAQYLQYQYQYSQYLNLFYRTLFLSPFPIFTAKLASFIWSH